LRISQSIRDWQEQNPGKTFQFLNLFAYTGAASILVARAGARVVHLDVSRAMAWFYNSENQAPGINLLFSKSLCGCGNFYSIAMNCEHGASYEFDEPIEQTVVQKKRKKKVPAPSLDMNFATSKAGYSDEAGYEFDLERREFGLGVGYNVSSDLQLMAGFSRIIRTSAADIADLEGEGYKFGFGIAKLVNRSREFKIKPFLKFDYTWRPKTFTVQ
jgi:hypothetical protein